MKLAWPKKRIRAQRWFFATDVHGSDQCYRKFLAAADVYGADVLLLGGDVAGKGIVPIVTEGDRYRCTFQRRELLLIEDELSAAKDRITYNGLYPYVCDATERAALHEPEHRADVFNSLIANQLEAWIALTEQRLDERKRCVITPGNDDPTVVDEVLARAERIDFLEGQLTQIGPARLASLGNTNATPWGTEREYDEATLAAQIDEMLADYEDGSGGLIFNFHCPPYNSGLDVCAELDENFRPVTRGGGVVEIPVGSTAVREAIERYQPSVGLHGHIHESRGIQKIGTTRCFNPGSDYSSGVLAGLILDLDDNGEYLDHIFTSG